MMLDNNWYGHRSILASFCKTKDKSSFSIIQHGWSAYYNDGNFGYKKKLSPPSICWSDTIKEKCIEKGVKNIHSIGAPFLYLSKILKTSKNDLDNQNEKGTIYFPSHNTTSIIDTKTEHEKIRDEIEKISEAPFAVCFYYADLTEQNIKIYRDNNWRIVCCGNRSDVKMLYKVYLELSKHKKVIVSEISSIIFYAMYLKKKIKLLKKVGEKFISVRSAEMQKNFHTGTTKKYRDDYNKGTTLSEKYENNLTNNFPSIINGFLDEEVGYEIAKKELGHNSLKSPEELKKILGWSSYLKIFLSKIFSIYFNLKHGSKIRSGENEISYK